MKKLVHKNQIIITSLALLVAACGYLSFQYDIGWPGKEESASEKLLSEEELLEASAQAEQNQASSEENVAQNENSNLEESAIENGELSEEEIGDMEDAGSSILVSSSAVSDYVAAAKLKREQTRAKSKEELNAIIDNKELGEDAKSKAVEALIALTEASEKEAAIENVLEAKGYNNVVVCIMEDSVDVLLVTDDLDDISRAQIEDVVKGKVDVPLENIVLTPIRTK